MSVEKEVDRASAVALYFYAPAYRQQTGLSSYSGGCWLIISSNNSSPIVI